VHIYRALLRIYRALLQIYKALVSEYRALSRIYRALLRIFRALLRIERTFLQRFVRREKEKQREKVSRSSAVALGQLCPRHRDRERQQDRTTKQRRFVFYGKNPLFSHQKPTF